MSLRSAYFCDFDETICGSFAWDDSLASCPICERQFCQKHANMELRAALTLSYFHGSEGSSSFVKLCSKCARTYKSVLKTAEQKTQTALRELERETLEELKLAHTAKALKE